MFPAAIVVKSSACIKFDMVHDTFIIEIASIRIVAELSLQYQNQSKPLKIAWKLCNEPTKAKILKKKIFYGQLFICYVYVYSIQQRDHLSQHSLFNTPRSSHHRIQKIWCLGG